MALYDYNQYPSTSVVNLLGQRGFQQTATDPFPYYDLRKQVFSKAGLAPTEKEFRGTSNENQALYNFLVQQEKKSGVSINPSNIWDVIGYGSQPVSNTGLRASVSDIDQSGKIINTQNYLNNQLVNPPTGTAPVEDKTPSPPEPTTLSTDTLEYLFGKSLSPDELLKQATESITKSATYPLTQEAQAAEKTQLQINKQRDTEEFIRNIASKGLIFSGRKTEGVNTIDADYLAKQFDIDRKYALLLAQGIQSAAQDIAKEAAKGNPDALTSLRSLGYDVNPLTGQIEPTLAARKAEESETRAEESAANVEARFQQSQEAIESRFQRTQERLTADRGEPSPTKGGLPSIFFNAVDDVSSNLKMGTLDWGSAWNRIKAQFPGIDNTTIDQYLGGQEGATFWKTPGAFELYTLRIIQGYKDSGYKKADIEEMYTNRGVAIPPAVKSALDQLFGKKK